MMLELTGTPVPGGAIGVLTEKAKSGSTSNAAGRRWRCSTTTLTGMLYIVSPRTGSQRSAEPPATHGLPPFAGFVRDSG